MTYMKAVTLTEYKKVIKHLDWRKILEKEIVCLLEKEFSNLEMFYLFLVLLFYGILYNNFRIFSGYKKVRKTCYKGFDTSTSKYL